MKEWRHRMEAGCRFVFRVGQGGTSKPEDIEVNFAEIEETGDGSIWVEEGNMRI